MHRACRPPYLDQGCCAEAALKRKKCNCVEWFGGAEGVTRLNQGRLNSRGQLRRKGRARRQGLEGAKRLPTLSRPQLALPRGQQILQLTCDFT